MIARLEGDIAGFSQRLCDKLLAQADGGGSSGPEPFDVAVAYSNLATDVVSGYCFGENFGLLAQPGWHPNFRDPTSEFWEAPFLAIAACFMADVESAAVAVLKPMFAFRFFPFIKRLAGIATA